MQKELKVLVAPAPVAALLEVQAVATGTDET